MSLLLAACGGSSDSADFDSPIEAPAAAPPQGPVFDPAGGRLPTTNNLFARPFLGISGIDDGTLNIPNTSNNPIIPQLNTLDGFSTSNPVIVDFGMPLEQVSLSIGTSIHIFEVTTAGPAITGVVRKLTAAEITPIATGADSNTLALVPKAPLNESTSYMVVLTNGINVLNSNSDPVASRSPAAYILAKGTTSLVGTDFEGLEPIRLTVNNMENVADAAGVAKENIVLSFSFTTQSITPVLNAVASSAKAENLVVVPTGQTTNDVNSNFLGQADVYIGTLDIPYYLEAPTAADPIAPLTGYWKGTGGSSLTRFNSTPVSNTTLTIPVMMTVPNIGTKPAAGWPIVIYQHGITRVRTDVLVYADAMAQAGFAVIAIDLPLHGAAKTVTVGGVEVPNPFHASQTAFDETELTFDLDLSNNDTGAAGSDTIIDSSGTHFINLQSLLTSRDNVRQGVSNLLTLRRSLGNIINVATDPVSMVDIDTSRIGFVAHSLGGVVAVPYMAVESQSLPTSLVTTGAPISKIVDESGSFGPRIKAGLAAAGITGDALTSYFQAVQFISDSADPVNFASAASAKHAIHMIKVNDDGTIPNSTTDILSALIGAKDVSATVTDIAPGNAGIVTFTEGAHSSPLDPSQGLDVFKEMHSQMATFQATGGTTISIDNSAGIIQQ
jgi:dienelactone hydrolase